MGGFVFDALLSILAFALVLGVVMVVHEMGHFLTARATGVAVDTFSIGWGRSVFAWVDKRGVRWSLGSLPIGAYVSFKGDEDPSSTKSIEIDESARAAARAKGFFPAMPVWVRAVVAAGGPFSNFLFAILAFALLIFIVGQDKTDLSTLTPRIDGVAAGGPAATAGVLPGDIVTSIDGRSVNSFGEFQEIVRANAGKTITLGVSRAGAPASFQVVVGERKIVDEGGVEKAAGFLGVERETRPEERRIERLGPLESIGAGAGQTWSIIAQTGAYIGNIFSGRASAEHIAGPAGIFDMSGKVARSAVSGDRSLGKKIGDLSLALVAWAATLSVAVGIANLLPVPILDGGQLVFLAIESLRGRPLSRRAQEFGFRAGLMVLASLFLFATWNDLQRLKLLEFLGGILS